MDFFQVVTTAGAVVTIAVTLLNVWHSYWERASVQAAKISVWREENRVVLRNTGLQPAYSVIVSAVVVDEILPPSDLGEAMLLRRDYGGRSLDFKVNGFRIDDANFRAKVAVLPPGLYSIEIPESDRRDERIAVYELAFRDSRNVVWVRCADGRLRRKWFAKNPGRLYKSESLPKSWAKFQRMQST